MMETPLSMDFDEYDSDSDDDHGFSDSDSGSFDSDFDPETLKTPNKVQTPRPSLTELQGILSKLDLNEEFMLQDVKKEIDHDQDDIDNADNIDNVDHDDTKQKDVSDQQTPTNLPNKRRPSEPINKLKEDREVKHTDSLSAIKVNKRWYINQYLCYKYLGKGAFGKVALAKDITSKEGDKYAIKVLNKSLLRRKRILRKNKPPSNMLENIFREIAIMKKLNHPNVLQIHEVIDDPENDKLFMVIDYMNNGSVLGEKGAEAKCDPMEDHELIRRYIRDMILGLDYLHANDIIHGDIKPENLLLSKEHHLKIADFGVSFMLDDETCPNKDGKISRSQGTPAFTAPETGSKSFEAYPIDVWAMGVTLYMMITGVCPFAGNGIYDTYEKIQNEHPEIPQNIDENMRDFLERILQKDPEQRITLKQAMQHPWITKNGSDPLHHPESYKNHKFEKRVSITKEDIEYGLSLRSDTVKHLRKASKEFQDDLANISVTSDDETDVVQQPEVIKGTKHRGSVDEARKNRGSIEVVNEQKDIEMEMVDVNQVPYDSEDDEFFPKPKQQTRTPVLDKAMSKKLKSNKKSKKPIKKLPQKQPPKQNNNNTKTVKSSKKNESAFVDGNKVQNVKYNAKPIKIATNSAVSKKKHSKTTNSNRSSLAKSRIKSKKKPNKPTKAAPSTPKTKGKSNKTKPKKPTKPAPKNKGKMSRKSVSNVKGKKKNKVPKNRALPPSIDTKRQRKKEEDEGSPSYPRNISPSFVKKRRSLELKKKKKGKVVKKKGKTKKVPKGPKNKPLPKSNRRVK